MSFCTGPILSISVKKNNMDAHVVKDDKLKPTSNGLSRDCYPIMVYALMRGGESRFCSRRSNHSTVRWPLGSTCPNHIGGGR